MTKAKINQLESLKVFKTVVECGSFTAAAAQLNMSTAWVSMSINRLEEFLGITLLNRNTRTILITKEGEYCLSQAVLLLNQWQELEDDLTHSNDSMKGRVSISIPVSWGVTEFGKIAAEFNELYPDIVLDIELSDSFVDVLSSNFDLVLRIANELSDSSLLCQKVTSYHRIACATPQYLKLHGTPLHPKELSAHRTLFYSMNNPQKSWCYMEGESKHEIFLTPAQLSNNSQLLHYSLMAHQGIALIPEFIVREDIKQDRVTVLFERFDTQPLNLYLLKPNKKHPSERIKLLHNFIYSKFNIVV